MKICLSIAPSSMDEAFALLRSEAASYDLAEVRIDTIKDLDLGLLLKKPRPPLIITNRKVSEGGNFQGGADEQLQILTRAIALGAEYVDIEISWGGSHVSELVSRSGRCLIICSYHNFQETPRDLISTYRKIRRTGADIVKIAVTARDISDNNKIYGLLRNSKTDRQKTIGLCMGDAGESSRVLSGIYGGFLTFGRPPSRGGTAPGQLCVIDLKKTFHVGSLDRRTKIFGLIGNPVKFSSGIYEHNRRFLNKKANAVYVNFLVTDIKRFLEDYRGRFTGLSVTMPFKQEAVPLVDSLDENARELNILNTIINKRGSLKGYNTDLEAIVSILGKRTSLRNKSVVVLGTGATSKTMAYAAVRSGAKTTVVGRSEKKARSLARELNCAWTTFEEFSETSADILMNGTPVGMPGRKAAASQAPEGSILPDGFLKKGMLVFDAVYNPPNTRLLSDGRRAGCRIISGLELFKCQARLQSKLFLDCIP